METERVSVSPKGDVVVYKSNKVFVKKKVHRDNNTKS